MSNDALGELVPIALPPPSSAYFNQENTQCYGSDTGYNSSNFCFMCEVVDDSDRFTKSQCRCGYQVE